MKSVKHFKKISFLVVVVAIGIYFNQEKSDQPTLKEEVKSDVQNKIPEPEKALSPEAQLPAMVEIKQVEEKKEEIAVPQNRPWKKKVEKDLLAFMPKETTINVEVLEILKEKNMHDVAKITYKKKDGATSSFKALIETRSGKILRTWDQAVFEPNPHKRISIAISGEL